MSAPASKIEIQSSMDNPTGVLTMSSPVGCNSRVIWWDSNLGAGRTEVAILRLRQLEQLLQSLLLVLQVSLRAHFSSPQKVELL